MQNAASDRGYEFVYRLEWYPYILSRNKEAFYFDCSFNKPDSERYNFRILVGMDNEGFEVDDIARPWSGRDYIELDVAQILTKRLNWPIKI